MDLEGKLIGHYLIIEKLGEGGMAIVYLANDENLNRKVALKVIRADKSSNQTYLKRFEREARALAHLDHANIVHINDFGEHDGTLYLVMDYISGGTLKQKLGKVLPVAEAANILAPIARALDYAHKNNIVHRDVKPANILLSEIGQPMLTDFGIAKILELEETLELTATGMGLGTPDYMAPEQWTGKAESLTDQYALGVIFFEMITGQKPFSADTPAAILLRHVNEPVPQPRKIVQEIPTHVESVIFKALAKQPEDRFKDMGEFAIVLEKLATGKPVIVKDNFLNKNKRKRYIWGIALIGILLVTIAFLGIKGGWGRSAKTANDVLVNQQKSAPISTAVESTEVIKPVITTVPSITITPTLSYPLLAGTLIPELNNISLDNSDKIIEIARWGKGQINAVVISADNQTLYVGTSIGIFMYVVDTLKEIHFIPGRNVRSLVLSGDGKKLAFIEDEKIKTLDLETNNEDTLYEGSGLLRLQYLSSGKLYAIGQVTEGNFETVQILNLSDSIDPILIETGGKGILGGEIALSGDLVVIYQSKAITSYDLTTSKKIRSFAGIKSFFLTTLAISPDQSLAASGDYDGNVYIWDMKNGQPIYIFSNTTEISYLRFSPDGKKVLASLTNGTIQAWDVASGKKEISFSGHINLVTTFSFSQNGSLMVSGTQNGEIILWKYPDGDRIAAAPADSGGITSLDISPDESIVATGGNDYNVILWDSKSGQKVRELSQITTAPFFSNCSNCSQYGVESLMFSPDGYTLAAGYSMSESAVVWDVNSGKPTKDLEGNALAYCKGQSFIVSASLKAIHFYDLASGAETNKFSGNTCSFNAVACSPNGNILAYRGTLPACGGLPDKVVLMKLDNKVDLFEFRGDDLYGNYLTFSPDGKLLAGATSTGIRFWDTQTGREISGPMTTKDIYPIFGDFSYDGSMFAYISDLNHLSLFDIVNNKVLHTLEVLTSDFRAVHFSRDGKILMTGHSDGTIRVWGLKP